MNNRPKFDINRSESTPSCLPTDLDTTGFIDVTPLGAPWRKYYDPETGKTHDGAEYYRQAKEQLTKEGKA